MGNYLSNDDFSCSFSKRSNRPLEFNSSTFEKLNEMWCGGGRLFEFKWAWEGGRVGWALIRGLALIRGWALNRINTVRQKIASERKALVAGWSYTQ